ncbi:hypothetical protein B0H19DRAFT_197674 [Mycena capillaripes]|nr:hypothetical protein B0H19DRAFT_197674 [Mycena capillaripes]
MPSTTAESGLHLLKNAPRFHIVDGQFALTDAHNHHPGPGPQPSTLLNTLEIWNSPLVGSFKVRRGEVRPQKPQQRVTIYPFRGPLMLGPKPPPHVGAFTTIHKHSKVAAFSIYRHYERASQGSSVREQHRRLSLRSIILLAPRHVQEAYTSYETTRGGGLLDEGHHRDMQSTGRGKEAEREKAQQRGRGVEGASRKHKQQTNSDEGATSAARGWRDSLDDDNDSDYTQGVSARTTNRDAFSTMDASWIEQMDTRNDEVSNGMLSRVLGRTATRPTGSTAPHQAYVPPWVTLQNRAKQKESLRRHDVLGKEDSALLPQKSTGGARGKKMSVTGVDIFADVPPDALFMLLPLWPGPTDPVSERNATRPPYEIPREQRQYLLVLYHPMDVCEPKMYGGHNSSGREKGTSGISPTSSADAGVDNGRDVLFGSFHISARLVSHADLQGSAVSVPDEGLAVRGSWLEAWLNMPQTATRDYGMLVVGTYVSREAGIEFNSEVLVKMGLGIPAARHAPKDEDELQEALVAEITPLGKAVLEMVWIGCICVTSFGSAGSSLVSPRQILQRHARTSHVVGSS